MATRKEIDGAKVRSRVFALLRGFDAKGLDEPEFQCRAFALS